jgi:hypothetical protein
MHFLHYSAERFRSQDHRWPSIAGPRSNWLQPEACKQRIGRLLTPAASESSNMQHDLTVHTHKLPSSPHGMAHREMSIMRLSPSRRPLPSCKASNVRADAQKCHRDRDSAPHKRPNVQHQHRGLPEPTSARPNLPTTNSLTYNNSLTPQVRGRSVPLCAVGRKRERELELAATWHFRCLPLGQFGRLVHPAPGLWQRNVTCNGRRLSRLSISAGLPPRASARIIAPIC